MKILLTLTILISITFGFAIIQTPIDEKLVVTETSVKIDSLFRQVVDFPMINDTTKFISDLKQLLKHQPFQKENEKITYYNKVKIYGSDLDFIFIEYDYGDGSMASFPWKYQILLLPNGKMVKILPGYRFEFVEIFKNRNPFLLTVIRTAKGNGGHELYKFSADTLENVYEGYFDYAIRTYDKHQDNSIYEPNELTLKVKDFNNDGYNDISFYGKIVLLKGQTKNGDWYDFDTINGKTIFYSMDNPFKKIPIEFIFLYDKQTGHFKAKENYKEKYGLDK